MIVIAFSTVFWAIVPYLALSQDKRIYQLITVRNNLLVACLLTK